MKTGDLQIHGSWKFTTFLLYNRWPWHVLFWLGYVIFRFWVYYITVEYYPRIYLEYMLLSEIMFVGMVYFTVLLYERLFKKNKFYSYFIIGAGSWIAYLYARTVFQFTYLKGAPGFQRNSFEDMMINNVTVVIVYFLFITSLKYFKDGYIRQHFEAAKKEEQLIAEVKNLKSQIAPHFLFNTLNNLYGLAVEKSDKLPDLMLRLSDLLRHSLYETEKPFVPIDEELSILNSYIELERIRLEEDLQLEFNNSVPAGTAYKIAPLILIVFVENAFKHAKFVNSETVNISINTAVEKDWFVFTTKNNYNNEKESSGKGLGLINVRRRLDVLYPKHQLQIVKGDITYSVELRLPLIDHAINDHGN